jgi:molecular chaperone HtpG
MTKRSFSAETGKVLQLMIHSLYTNRDIFLRELISNASDACDKLRYEAVSNGALIAGDSELMIRVQVEPEQKRITIEDNGVGMNEADMVANLGTIAKSGTQEFVSNLSGDKASDVELIGQFGVGFYSAFMVADTVTVYSRKAGEEQGWQWESDGTGEYTIATSEEAPTRGTRIVLSLRDDAADYLDKFKLEHIIQTYSDHISFPIMLQRDAETPEKANAASALWTRSKSEITEEQYNEFYRSVAHLPDSPWLTLHQKAEGKLEYTSLLFIPSMKPFDLFHPDRKRRVKLYVKRVFITEEGVELIPHYMRFLRGLVDSQDLPLNISRETLQHNPLLAKMSEAIVKKTLTELKKRADKDLADYISFWKNFGAVLKEGLCEALAPKEQILEASLFFSSLHDAGEEDFTRLDSYLERMRDGQEFIYYLTADSLEAARLSPQLEGFRKRGIEVLLLTDHVDDFWLNVVSEYKGKKFKSVTRAADDLEKFAANETEEEKKDEPKLEKDAVEGLVAALKAALGEEVRDVRTTAKLAESPVCLAVGEHDMDIRLEQFLRGQKQYPGRTAKILEINPTHPIIHALAAKVKDGALPEDAKEAALLLLDQARLMEGEEISNPGAFARRISMFMAKSLAA